MKKFTVEYLGYKLEVEVEFCSPICYPRIIGTCKPLSFVKKDTYGSYQDILDEFMKCVDREYEEEARNESLAFRD